MKKSEILWKIIKKNNIKYVFGLPGSPIVPILAYKPNDISWINIGNELDNGFISQSYGFFSETVGVLIVTGGPGIGTSLSALANALYEKNPLIIVSIFEKKSNGFQNWDIIDISKEITPHTIIIRYKDDFERKINYAFYVAKTFNTGVSVLIEDGIILDSGKYSNIDIDFSKLFHFTNPSQIVKTLNKSLNNTDTLLVVGYMPHIDYQLFKKFITKNNIPFVLTWKERTLISDKNYCGIIGSLGHHSANYAVYHATNLLIFGDISNNLNNSTYNEAFSMDYKIKKKYIFSLVIDKSIAISSSTNILVTNNFNYIFQHLIINTPLEFTDKLNITNSILGGPLIPKSDLEKYCYISSVIYSNKNLDIPLVTGVGNHWYSIGKYFMLNKPNNWLSSTEWASIGSGYFYGLGAYLAKKKPVWIIEGDGGTIFAGTTLLYLINNKHLPLTIIQFKDTQYSAIVSSFDLQNLTTNHKKNKNSITNVPEINDNILPNCHHFHNFKDYYSYLNKYPISTNLRFIIVHIKKKILNNSAVYTTNIHEKKYISLLQHNKLEEIKNYETVYKQDKHN